MPFLLGSDRQIYEERKASFMNKEIFDLKKELLLMERENRKLEHEYKIKEMKDKNTFDKLHHERELERQRIKSAEIRKDFERRMAYKDYGSFKQ